RPRPLGGEQPPGAGGRDVRGAELAAAEADVGGERIPGRHLLDHLAAGRDHRDGAGHERRDADVAGAVDGERVEELEAREPGQERTTPGAEAGRGHDLTRPGQLPVPDAPGPRLGDVEPAPVGREADAVRRIEREDHLAYARAVGARVEDAGAVAIALAHLAVVGEPEAASRVEDDVVRAAERPPVARPVEVLDLAGREGDALDAAARVVVRLVPRHEEPAHLVPLEAAVVADVDQPVGADGGPVRPAAGLRDDGLLPVPRDAGQRAALDLDHQHAAVVEGDGPFGELEAARDLAHLGHGAAPSLDGHDRTAVRVELVQVLGDTVAGAALVGPAREPLVDERAAPAHRVRHRRDAQQIAAQRVHAPALVGGAHVRDRVRDLVGRELGAHVPLADAARLAVAPHPAAVEVARLGADADAAEVRVVADVDREPAPHGGSAPAPRPPRLVAVAARLAERVAHAVGLDPAAPAAGLL